MAQKQVPQLDTDGYFVGLAVADDYPLEPGIWHIPAGAVDAPIPVVPDGMRALWDGVDFQLVSLPEPEPEPDPEPTPPLTQFEIDQRRYQHRATAYAELMSWMSADNVSRVRSGAWTLPDLKSLMADPAITAAQAYMSMLSYELAAQSIQEATTPLLTPEIKAAWVSQLQAHF